MFWGVDESLMREMRADERAWDDESLSMVRSRIKEWKKK